MTFTNTTFFYNMNNYMIRKTFLLSLFALLINVCIAQQTISEAQQLVEQADLAAKKSFNRGSALKCYLSASRLYIKEKDPRTNCAPILTKVKDLIKPEKYLMAKDGVFVDSLLEETYELFTNDTLTYLPLLETYVQRASGTDDKYRRCFELYDRAIAIRTDNSFLKGNGYETLLRWYAGKLSYRKEVTKDDKLALYTNLWKVYQDNNQGRDTLDMKLLDAYHAAFGLNGNEEEKVQLSEIKTQYIKRHFGEESDAYLNSLQLLVSDYFSLAKKEEKKGIMDNVKVKESDARKELWSLQKKRDEIYDENAQNFLSSLVFGLVNDMNDTIQAKAFALENIEKIGTKFGKDSKQYIGALDILLQSYDMFDKEQIPILEEKLDLEKRHYGKDDWRAQATSYSLSMLYSANHRMAESLAISESHANEDDYLTLMALAASQAQYGQYREAIATHDRLLNLCVKEPGLKGTLLLTSVLGTLNSLHAINDTHGMLEFGMKWINEESFSFDEQMYVFSQVVGMASLPGNSNDEVAAFADSFILSHNSMMTDPAILSKVLEYKASVLYGMLKFDEAIIVLKQIIACSNSTQEKLNRLKYSSELESCLLAKGDYQSALTENEKNRKVIMSIPGYEHTLEYLSMCARACICLDMLKEYDKIGEFSDIVNKMDISQATQLDPTAPFEINNFSTFLWMLTENSIVRPTLHYYCAQNKLPEAKSYIQNHIAGMEGTIKFSLGQLDSKNTTGQYGYMKTANDYLTGIAMLDIDDHEIAQQTFDYTLLYKQAFLASETQMREQILNSGNETIKTKFVELQTLRNTVQTYQKAGLDAAIIQEQVSTLEKQLIEDSKAYGDFTAALNLKWTDILDKLDAESCVVEFISYEDMTNDGKRAIAAAVLSKFTQRPILIPLGSEESFNKADIYTSYETGENIWKPIIGKMGDVKKIYFSPSGIFYDIAIENLPYKDGIISDLYDMVRISSSRKICESPGLSGTKSLVFGGIDYESDMHIEQGSTGSRAAISDIPYLPGTKIEAEQIHGIMSNNNVNSSLHIGKDGSESKIKQLKPFETKVLHIATHGFYKEHPVKYDNIVVNPLTRQGEDEMLTNSGILMAGAQLALDGETFAEGVEDGILTAQEISTLDLRGLDLVTLSACETAKGDITGDGVFGLQRGFKKAGANTMLMSLWKVDDNATSKLMTEFYSNWIEKKMSKRGALEEAKRTVRETKGWEDPKYWAAFILLDGLD